MPMELEMAELERLLGRRLVSYELSSDFIELIFEDGTLIIEIIEDGGMTYLHFRVV